MASKLKETLQCVVNNAFGGDPVNRISYLTHAYAFLSGVPIHQETVRAWLNDDMISGVNRTSITWIDRLSSLVGNMENIQYESAAISLLQECYSFLQNGVKDSCYLYNTMAGNEYRAMTNGYMDAKSRDGLVRNQAASMFVWLCYWSFLDPYIACVAALMCDTHLLVNGIGSFIPSGESLAYIVQAMSELRRTEPSMDNDIAKHLVFYVSERCIWCV